MLVAVAFGSRVSGPLWMFVLQTRWASYGAAFEFPQIKRAGDPRSAHDPETRAAAGGFLLASGVVLPMVPAT